MLQAIRDKLYRFAWIFIVAVSIPFVFWGVQDYMVGGDAYAVKVDGNEVTAGEYERLIDRNRQFLLQSFRGQIPPYFDADGYLREQTLNQLVDRTLIEGMIDKYGYRVAETTLNQRISQDPVFQIDGKYDPRVFQEQLRSQGVSPQEYKDMIGKQLLTDQIRQGLEQSAFALNNELAEYARLRNQVRDFEYVVLPYSVYEKNAKVTEADVVKYYEDNKANLLTDEKVKIQYIELNLAELADKVVVSEDALRGLYDEGLAAGQYKTEEVRDASHILVRLPDNASAAEVAEKEAKAKSILEKLRRGESFAAVAKTESEDPGSAEQGGSLGEVRHGMMVKPFEDALFSLPVGVLSEPVRTRFGFHIIKVNKVKGAEVQSFAELKSTLEQEYRSKQAETEFYDAVNQLETLSFENPDELETIAETVGVPVKETGFFSRAGNAADKITVYPQAVEAAFSESVLVGQQNSALLEVDSGHIIVLRVKEHQPSRQQTLAEARDSIMAGLKRERAVQAMDTAITAAMQVPAGKPLNASVPGDYKSVRDVPRTDTKIPREILQAAFQAPAPAAGQPTLNKAALPNGDMAIVRVTKVAAGDIARLDQKERSQLEQQIVDARGSYYFSALMAGLKERADIDIGAELQQPAEQEQQQ
jgi:peptidyl-prolyl cis-trans isomerase D